MEAWSSARASVHVLQALLVIIAKSVRVQRISRYSKAINQLHSQNNYLGMINSEHMHIGK